MNALLKLVANYWHPEHIEGEAKHVGDLKVGEFKADYSPLTPEEIAQDDPEMVELLNRSKPVSR